MDRLLHQGAYQPLPPENCSSPSNIGCLPEGFIVLGHGGFPWRRDESCDCHLAAAIKVNAAVSPRLGPPPAPARWSSSNVSWGNRLSGAMLDLEAESRRAPRVGGALGSGQNPVLRACPARPLQARQRFICRAARRRRGGFCPLALRWCFISAQRPVAHGGKRWEAEPALTLVIPGAARAGGWRRERITELVGGPGACPSFLAYERRGGFSGGPELQSCWRCCGPLQLESNSCCC